MEIQPENLKQIEVEVDNYLFNQLDERIPRYKFIYHMNLAYIDYVITNKILFSTAEKHFYFHWVIIRLLLIKTSWGRGFNFEFDNELYDYCFKFLILGMQYSMLCDVFPAINSKKPKPPRLKN